MHGRLVASASLILGVAGAGAALVQNPGFEADGTAIKGVGYIRQGNALSGWQAGGDGECARVTAGLAFFDNGACPEGAVVVALQNRSVLRQDVGPFAADRVYCLTLRTNGRASDLGAYGRCGTLEVRLNGTLLIGPARVQAVEAAGQFARPFAALSARFVTGGGRLSLELRQTDPADGISVLVDDVRIEPDEGAAATAIAVNRARIRSQAEPVAQADFRTAQWLWSKEATDPLREAPAAARWFRRLITVPDTTPVRQALLIGAADNHGEVFVNGIHQGALAGFSEWYQIDFTRDLRAGANVVAVEAVNAGTAPNPAGWVAMVLLLAADGSLVQPAVPTDEQWRCGRTRAPGWETVGFDDSGWEKAVPIGVPGCPPWGDFGFLTWQVPADFPEFIVPGREREMALLRQLFWLHYPQSGPLATLWDGWMSLSSLWPATGPGSGRNTRRERWRQALLARRIDREGYVSTHQHHGFGHGEGWPFPTYAQAQGVGWVFQTTHLAYRMPWTGDVAGWTLDGLTAQGLTQEQGWRLQIAAEEAALETPGFDIDHVVGPWLRVEWEVTAPATATATVEWTTADEPGFAAARSLPLPLVPDAAGGQFTHVPLYRHAGWTGHLTRFRLRFHRATGASLRLLTLCAAPDTRHTVNNPCYLQGCTEYVSWTGDVGFLAQNLSRMRAALAFAIREFRVEQVGCVFPPWIGHEGTSGIGRNADGGRRIDHGRGIGANYWDLLPFSGRDCLATLYLIDALRRMAALEQSIAAHPEWGLPVAAAELAAPRLRELAQRLVHEVQQRFWNPETGRFAACVDAGGIAHDYGYTFVNCEALYYGVGTDSQARAILDWLCGRRTVADDTSTGADIYHFRFGPRATTRRNTEWYTFPWSAPEGIPWGGQVQDGGAVLGFAFHEQMARLRHAGPDDAWAALQRTLDWFADVRAAGGYRPYYQVPGRGTLQGGGTPGGLGMDCEFFESVLVPQVMLYGFLGFAAEPEGFALAPRLPSDWPSLTLNRIHFRDVVLRIEARADSLRIGSEGEADCAVRLRLPPAWRVDGAAGPGADGTPVVLGRGRTVSCRKGD